MHDFDKRFAEMGRSHKRMRLTVNVMLVIVPVLIVMVATVIIYTSVQAGCLRSMILNGVCLSDPKIDNAIKNIIK